MKVYELVRYYSEFEPPIPYSKLFKTKSSAYLYILKQRYEQWEEWHNQRNLYRPYYAEFKPEIFHVNEFEIRERELLN